MYIALHYYVFPLLAALGGLCLGRVLAIPQSVRAIGGVLGVVIGLMIEGWVLGALSENRVQGCPIVYENDLEHVYLVAFYLSAVATGVAVSALRVSFVGLTALTLVTAFLIACVFNFAGILNGAASCP